MVLVLVLVVILSAQSVHAVVIDSEMGVLHGMAQNGHAHHP